MNSSVRYCGGRWREGGRRRGVTEGEREEEVGGEWLWELLDVQENEANLVW